MAAGLDRRARLARGPARNAAVPVPDRGVEAAAGYDRGLARRLLKVSYLRAHLRELYRRILFSVLTSNTDDHLLNHAFLRERDGWALSPAYDLNPDPHNPTRLSTAIDFDDTSASIDIAVAVCGHSRLSAAAALELLGEVERATSSWRDVARQLGLPGSEIEHMAEAYETEQRSIARGAAPA